jgi:hypothetical protein
MIREGVLQPSLVGQPNDIMSFVPYCGKLSGGQVFFIVKE